MPRFTATWTNTEKDDWQKPPRNIREEMLTELLQNIEWFAQSHNHSGDAGDGGPLWFLHPTASLMVWGGAM